MNINPMAFVDNLYYMGMGMLCILIVMGIIIACINGLNKFAEKLDEKAAKKDAQ